MIFNDTRTTDTYPVLHSLPCTTVFRAKAKAAYYLPLDTAWGLAFLGQGGYVLGLGEDVSIAERFFIGGHTFRGFEKAGIGPRDVETDHAPGGTQYNVGMVLMTFQHRLPEVLGLAVSIFTYAAKRQ